MANAVPQVIYRSREEVFGMYVLDESDISEHIERLFAYDFSYPPTWYCSPDELDICTECKEYVASMRKNALCYEKSDVGQRYRHLLEQNALPQNPKMDLAQYYKSAQSRLRIACPIWRADTYAHVHSLDFISHNTAFPFAKWLFHHADHIDLRHHSKQIKKHGIDASLLGNNPVDVVEEHYNLFMQEMLTHYAEMYRKLLQAEQALHYEAVGKLIKEIKSLDERRARFRNIPERRLCVICQNAERRIILPSCGHYLYCADCVSRLEECAVCKTTIDDDAVPLRVYD
jgi:hypothetical protein